MTEQTQILTPSMSDKTREAFIPFQFDAPAEDSFIRLCVAAPWAFEIVTATTLTQAGTCWLSIIVDDVTTVVFTATSGGAVVNGSNHLKCQSGGQAGYTASSSNSVAGGESVKVVVETLDTTTVDYLQGQLLIRATRVL